LSVFYSSDTELFFVESNENLYKDIDEFMSLQNKEKDIPIEERVQLIKRIKSVFLNTLTHCEEKVSLANQCYNSVQGERGNI
jgi:hypothetical protein